MVCIDKNSRVWYLKNGFISEEDYIKKHNYQKIRSEKDKVFCDLQKNNIIEVLKKY